jgi:hypothetical protein
MLRELSLPLLLKCVKGLSATGVLSFQTLRQDAMSKAVWAFDDSSKMDVAV